MRVIIVVPRRIAHRNEDGKDLCELVKTGLCCGVSCTVPDLPRV